MTDRVHVIGGGLAGLSAAIAASDAGRAISLYESGPACGGRCRSYVDRQLGCRIDNGNHLLLSGNTAAFAYLDRLGTRGTLGGPARPVFPFMDLATGDRWTLRPNAGRLPWWILVPSRRVPGSHPSDYAGLLKLYRADAAATVGDTLSHGALYRRLLEPLAIAALNTKPASGSARLMGAVVRETLAKGGAACIPAFPREGLSESFVDPALDVLRKRGADIRLGCRVAALTTDAAHVTGLATTHGPVTIGRSDRVVLAVPSPVATTLLPDVRGPDAFEAILNVHFRRAAPPGEAGFIGLIGGTTEWIFVKPGIVSVTISAANRLADLDADALVAIVWPEVRRALDLADPMPAWRVVRERRATFVATPAQDAMRPPARTRLDNLVLAGDWTATGLPATIEGAIRSGRTAAAAIRPLP